MFGNMLTEPPDATQRRCYDCTHLKAAVSWWCTNPAAVKARGTNIPGTRECVYWAPGKYEAPKPPLWQRLRAWARGK